MVSLPPTAGYEPPDRDTHPDYVPALPAAAMQGVPRQEPGVRPARPVPYDLNAGADVSCSTGTVRLRFVNAGRAAAVFQVRSGVGSDGPWTYTVGPGASLADSWDPRSSGHDAYDLSVYGPNGFLRAYKGSLQPGNGAGAVADLDVTSSYDCAGDSGITLAIRNRGAAAAKVRITDAYTTRVTVHVLRPGQVFERHHALDRSHGWYDFSVEVEADASFRQQLAGHVETGRDTFSDPALGA